jgi:hypothetical protein
VSVWDTNMKLCTLFRFMVAEPQSSALFQSSISCVACSYIEDDEGTSSNP